MSTIKTNSDENLNNTSIRNAPSDANISSNQNHFVKKNKTFLPNSNEITMEEISKIKSSLSSLDPNKLIEEALHISSLRLDENSKNIKQDDLLEQSKSNAIISFITELKHKNESEMQQAFIKRINEYNIGTQVIINRTNKEKDQYVSKNSSWKEENVNLRAQITQWNNEYRKLEMQLKNSETTISKLQGRFEIFSKHKAVFDEFISEFPDMEPTEIMKDLLYRKNESSSWINEYNKLLKEIEMIKKEKLVQERAAKKTIDELSDKIFTCEKDFRVKEWKYEKEIKVLKTANDNLQGYKNENIDMHKMLFHIYNQLIEELKLDKGITVDNKFFELKESDFTPDLFNNKEIEKYICWMLKTMKPASCDLLWRETIAYANMMIRVYLKDKINWRYDPVRTFKDLKNWLESKEEKEVKLAENIKCLELKISQLSNENIRLLSEVRTLQTQININMRVKESRFNKRMKQKRDMTGITKDSKLNKRESVPEKEKRNNNIQWYEWNKSNKEGIHFSTISETILDDNKKSGQPREHSIQPSNYKKNETSDTHISHSFDNERIFNKNKLRPKSVNQRELYKIKKKKHGEEYAYYNCKAKKLNQNVPRWTSIKNEAESFKEMKTSKNNDKLIKTHGYQNWVTNLAGFNNLVNHTNRLFLYKTKMIADHKNHLKVNRFKNVLDKHRPWTASQSAVYDIKIKNDILNKLDSIIDHIEQANNQY